MTPDDQPDSMKLIQNGICPSSRRVGVDTFYCDKEVNPVTGEHLTGMRHHASDGISTMTWYPMGEVRVTPRGA